MRLTPTPENQVRWVLERRRQNVGYPQIAAEFTKTFGESATPDRMRHIVRAAEKQQPRTPGAVPAAALAPTAPEAEPPHPLKKFTREHFTDTKLNLGDGLYIITAASPITSQSANEVVDGKSFGHNLVTPFWDAMTRFCDEMGARRIVLPMRAHMQALQAQPSHYDPKLLHYRDDFASEVSFNENLVAMDIFMNPQQAEPLTGLFRLRGRAAGLVHDDEWFPIPGRPSIFVAHAKQDMIPIATGNGTHPRVLHSTGACTAPEYLKNRVGRLAHDGHVVGALVVLVRGDQFHFWQVRAHPVDGSFCLGTWRFSSDKVERTFPLAVKLGDLHPGWDDDVALQFEQDLLRYLQPSEVYVEDWLDGATVTHHLVGKFLDKAMVRKNPVFRSLAAELEHARKRLLGIWEAIDGDLFLTASNHPEHLTGYLNQARYIKDPENYEIAHEMVLEILRGGNPLQDRLDPDRRFRWLSENDDRFVEGINFSCHGHLGPNGAKGSIRGIGKHLGAVMLAHAHSPMMLGEATQVGHSSAGRHGYNHPPSTWMLSHGAVYAGGQRTLYSCVNGQHGLDMLPTPSSILEANARALRDEIGED